MKKQTLCLYHISQAVNNGYDTYDSAVVAAPDEQAAQNTHPGGSELARLDTWAAPSDVKVRLLGKAAFKGEAHAICASFNAG